MENRPRLITPVLVVGCIIVLVGFAIRASFGVFQIPIQEEFDWPRAEFSLAIAIQNLAWGFGAPFFGAFAEKIGDRKAIILGAVLYAIGLVLTTGATSPFAIQFYEILVGFGIAGTGFGVILAVVGRASYCGWLGRSDSRPNGCCGSAREHGLAIGIHDIRRINSSSIASSSLHACARARG